RKIDNREGGMKAVVAGGQAGGGVDPGRGGGGGGGGRGGGLQLPKNNWARGLPPRVQGVNVECGGGGRGGQQGGGGGRGGSGGRGGGGGEGGGPRGAVGAGGRDRRKPALIIRGQQIAARAVWGQKRGRVGRRDRPMGREPTGGGVDPEARNRGHRAMPDIQYMP